LTDPTPTARLLASASGGDVDRLAEAVDILLNQRTDSHELVACKVRADAYGTRMSLAEAVCRHLQPHQVPKRAKAAFVEWQAEYERQTGEPPNVKGAA
jgi:hypothetical protein